MKHTIEQKERMKGLNSFQDFKLKIAKIYKLNTNQFVIKDNFIIIKSKMNES